MNTSDDNDDFGLTGAAAEGWAEPVNEEALAEARARLAACADEAVDRWTKALEAALQEFATANSFVRFFSRVGTVSGYKSYKRRDDGIISGGSIHDGELLCCQPFLTTTPLEKLAEELPVAAPRIVPFLLSLLIVRDAAWNNAASVDCSFRLLAISRPSEIAELARRDSTSEQLRAAGSSGGKAKGERYAQHREQAIAWYMKFKQAGVPKHERISKIVGRFKKKYRKQTIHEWVRHLHEIDEPPSESVRIP